MISLTTDEYNFIFLSSQMAEIVIKLCVQYAVLDAKFADNLILLIQTTLLNLISINTIYAVDKADNLISFILHPLSFCLLP